MAQNGLKQRVQKGETVVGMRTALSFSRDDFKKAMDFGPYDFAFVDGQHSAFSQQGLVDFCNMADEFDMPVRFRIEHRQEAHLIGNFLDLGPSGIEVPQVELVSEVDESIENFYYPPLGNRSFGGGARKSAEDLAAPEEYAEWWNSYGVLWIQVESVAAVINAYGLAQDGVDCVAFGPSDLALNLAHNPHPHLESVDDCVRHVVQALEGTPTAVCFRNAPGTRQKYADLGVTVFLESPGA